jgi:hypothetical protein
MFLQLAVCGKQRQTGEQNGNWVPRYRRACKKLHPSILPLNPPA